MRKRFFVIPAIALMALTSLMTTQSSADQIEISIENTQTADGFFLTPLWVAFHDGNFDTFDVGGTATASLEALAEGGDLSGIMGDFASTGVGQDGVITSPGGFAGAPVIDPGETAAMDFFVDPSEQYLSFLSMVIPSNDAFIGNDDGMAYQLFDGAGNYNGDFVIEIFGNSIWDAGTEVNDGQGAAFSANGGTDTSEALTIRVHPGLDNFIGTDTPGGFSTIGSGIGSGELLARISVTAVPEPTSLTILGLGAVALVARRRRR